VGVCWVVWWGLSEVGFGVFCIRIEPPLKCFLFIHFLLLIKKITSLFSFLFCVALLIIDG